MTYAYDSPKPPETRKGYYWGFHSHFKDWYIVDAEDYLALLEFSRFVGPIQPPDED